MVLKMTAKSTHLKVKGMHCTGCEETIENAVGHVPGVQIANADYIKQTVDIEFDSKSTGESTIRRVIEEKGYEFESAFTKSSSHAIRNGLIFLFFLLLVGSVTFWGEYDPRFGRRHERSAGLCHAVFHRIFYRLSLYRDVWRVCGGLCNGH